MSGYVKVYDHPLRTTNGNDSVAVEDLGGSIDGITAEDGTLRLTASSSVLVVADGNGAGNVAIQAGGNYVEGGSDPSIGLAAVAVSPDTWASDQPAVTAFVTQEKGVAPDTWGGVHAFEVAQGDGAPAHTPGNPQLYFDWTGRALYLFDGLDWNTVGITPIGQ